MSYVNLAASIVTLAVVIVAAATTGAFASAPLRLEAFPAQLVCVNSQGKIARDTDVFVECYRAHVVPADR